MSIARSRSGGQPFDSKRHRVVIHSAALSPLPWTNTIGLTFRLEGPEAQADSRVAAADPSKSVRR